MHPRGHGLHDRTRRVTITVTAELAEKVQELVREQETGSVSAYYASAAQDRVERDEFLRKFREITGGPPAPELRHQAQRDLDAAAALRRKVS